MLKCRCCGNGELESIIPLGPLPLANALLPSGDIQSTRHNLEVMLCKACGLAQLKDLIDPEELFSEYVYFSSNSDAMLASVAELVDRIAPKLSKDALAVEIASNDGYLLKNYIKHNIAVLGIDPAANIAKVANENGIHTICDFFGEDFAKKMASEGTKADVIHANNVMAHVPDINGFIRGLKIMLKDNGQAIIEVPHFLDLVEKLEFDTIYHEHVYYFSLRSLQYAFLKNGLEIFDVEKISMHGGSLRLFIGHPGRHKINTAVIDGLFAQEDEAKIHDVTTFKSFMEKLAELKLKLHELLSDLKKKEAKIAAYGASAKGTTLLNYFGIGKEYLSFVVDRSVAKQGKFTPGTNLSIYAPSHLIDENVSYALLLSWNFAKEILGQQQEFTKRGGRFIVPLPVVEVVG